MINFDGNYEVLRKIYTGAATGTALETVTTCDNGKCGTAPVGGVTEVNVRTSFNGSSTSRTDSVYNSYGLLTAKIEYDFGATSPTRETIVAYDTTLGNGVVDRPSQVTVTDGSGNVFSQTNYAYDEDEVANTLKVSGALELVAVTCTAPSGKCRGNATTVKNYVTAGTFLTRTFLHYDSGAVYQVTDVNTAVTTFTNGDCGNSFLTEVDWPLSLSESYTWNCVGGVKVSTTDANKHPSTESYTTDPDFWRPNSSTDNLGFSTTYGYTPTSVESTLLFNGNHSASDGLVTVDSLGRKQTTQARQAPGGTTFNSLEVDYAPLGIPVRQTVAYAGTKGQTNSTAPATSVSYDGMGRQLTVVDGGGGTTAYSYSRNDVLVTLSPAPTGENTKRRQFEYDGLGRLTSVCEVTSATGSASCGQYKSATGFLTKYTYDAVDNLVSVTQNAQAARVASRLALLATTC